MAKIWDEDGSEYPEFNKYSVEAKGLDEKQRQSTGFGPNLEEMVGLCASCKYYSYVTNSTHQLKISRCRQFNCSVGKDKVRHCSDHSPRNQMSLEFMYELAVLIDVDTSRKVISGFTNPKSKRGEHENETTG